ncbi:N-6 DNA methylase [Acidithiobacillus montserratensis]|uniref:N-6 DNA methylase n=1 Tax=Acidithiobacillus montserratensis TaxID=2729135 RepID=A0ACD5HIH4_9PROT|nr:N-6 DNA methylase [Acidithiobacillus montserratensis]MBU2747865.1 N-6 DNA methylase [Acidithiobacillus montserratensis]
MLHQLTQNLQEGANRSVTEEELRLTWLHELQNFLGITFQAERGRNDASYNQVIIEFKSTGLFGGRDTSAAFREAIHDRLKKYILAKAANEGLDPGEYIGIATDGKHIAFAYINNGTIAHGHIMPVSYPSVSLVVQACGDSRRRSVTPENLIEDFGHVSISGAKMMQALANALTDNLSSEGPNKIKMLFREWRNLYGQVADLSSSQVIRIFDTIGFHIPVGKFAKDEVVPAALFVIHTYDSLLIKLLGAEIVGSHGAHTSYRGFAEAASTLDDFSLLERVHEEIERGELFSRAEIHGFVEEVIFSWYLDAASELKHQIEICKALRNVLVHLAMYRTDSLTIARSRDVLKHLYQDLVPDTLRKSLGEFYTPDWLVEVALDKIGITDWLGHRYLDPTCGSASFLLAIVRRIRESATTAGWTEMQTLQHIVNNVWGFDLNPLAVQSARVNLLIAISDLLGANPGTNIELPILLADAVYSPARNPKKNEDSVEYTIGSSFANLKVTLPAQLAFDRRRLDDVFSTMGEMVEENADYNLVERKLIARKKMTETESVAWRKALGGTYGRVLTLHRKNWNGIWFRIVRNFFWSATAGQFDVVVGNPPWVRWSKLPELYRERVKPTCNEYDIFSSNKRHGGNELDISAMITYTVSDKWLRNGGKLAFLVTQTLFQSPSSEGFRRFRIKEGYRLIPKSVDDLKDLKPFPDAANKTAIFIAEKSETSFPSYPLPYFLWNPASGAKKTIPATSSKQSALAGVDIELCEATPVGGDGSPWAVMPVGYFASLAHLAGRSTWVQGRKGITVDLNGIFFVTVVAENSKTGLIQIETRPEAGKTNIGPRQRYWIEPDLLYPLLKGASDFSACHLSIKNDIYALVPNHGIRKEEYEAAEEMVETQLPKTRAYFRSFRSLLQLRSTYRGRMPNAPYYAIYNVGDYTFAPWKVIWAEQKEFCAAVVSKASVTLGDDRPIVPDHKLFFVEFDTPDPAYYLCGLLNTSKVHTFIQSHVIKTQIGNIFKHLQLPEFDQRNVDHQRLVKLVEEAHAQTDSVKRAGLLEKISELGGSLI